MHAGHVVTYKLNAVHMPIPLNELVDVSVLHPLGNHCESMFTNCHPKQWQDIRMPEVFPGDSLSAKPLWWIHPDGCDSVGGILTLRMTSRSLVMYTRTTFTAT